MGDIKARSFKSGGLLQALSFFAVTFFILLSLGNTNTLPCVVLHVKCVALHLGNPYASVIPKRMELQMNAYELKDLLGRQPESTLRFTLPTGDAIPAHFHLTEVSRVEKSFIDCSGTKRSTVSC